MQSTDILRPLINLIVMALCVGLVAMPAFAGKQPEPSPGATVPAPKSKTLNPKPLKQSDNGAREYRYQASIINTLDRELAINTAGVRWTCKGTACQAQGPVQKPSVSLCKSLAAQVGALSFYSQGSGSLNRTQLGVCNRGVSKTVNKGSSTSPASKSLKKDGKQAAGGQMVRVVPPLPLDKQPSKIEEPSAAEISLQGSKTSNAVDSNPPRTRERSFNPSAPKTTSAAGPGHISSDGSGVSTVSPARPMTGVQGTKIRPGGSKSGVAPERTTDMSRSGEIGPAGGGMGKMARESTWDPGTSHKGNRTTGPKYDSGSDNFVFSDGATVTGSTPSGERGRVNEKGDIVYSDGTIVTHDTADGSTTFVHPDGRTDTRYSRTDSHGYRPGYDPATDTFVYSDGTRITGSTPSGERGRVTEKGDIVYSDGTIVTHDPGSGSTTFVHPDGSTETIPGRGASYDGDSDTFVFSDGTRVRGIDPSGYRGKLNEDGSIQYSDGRRVSHDSRTGRTTIERPDGSTKVLDEYGGTVRAGPGSDVSAADGGGTTVRNQRTGVTVTFGASDSTTEEGAPKDGDRDSSSSDSSDTSDDSDDSSSDDDDSGSSDSDDESSGDDSDEGDTGDSDEKPDDDSEDGSKISFGEAGSGKSGPSDVVHSIADRLTGMSRERDGDGRSSKDCGSTGQPGVDPSERRGDCGDGAHDNSGANPRGNVSVAVPIDSRPSGRGSSIGSDCFDAEGCGEGVTGTRILSPFDRSPVVNPGVND